MPPEQLQVKNTDEKSTQPVVLGSSEGRNVPQNDDKVSSTKWDDSNANSTSTEQLSNVAKAIKSVNKLPDNMKYKPGDNLERMITSWIKADCEGHSNVQELSPSLPVPITPTRQLATNSNA